MASLNPLRLFRSEPQAKQLSSSYQENNKIRDVNNPETSRVKIDHEIATPENDIFLDFVTSNLVANPDQLLRTEGSSKGIELYERLLNDPQVFSTIQTRSLAVIGSEWQILPASEDDSDVEIAKFVEQVFMDFDFDGFRQALLTGLVTGYKPAEVIWTRKDNNIVIQNIVGKRPKRFVFDIEGNLRLLTFENATEGIPLPDKKFVVFKNISEDGSFYGKGLGSKLYWPVWFKKNTIKFWLIFSDKFGSPTAVGTYGSGTSKAEQTKLLDALTAIQRESGLIVPEGTDIKLLEAVRSGSVNNYESLVSFLNAEISKVVLGHSAAADSTSGRLGNEESAISIRRDYLKADADNLSMLINSTLIPWLIDFNFPNVQAYPKYWSVVEQAEDLKLSAERDKILVTDISLPVTKKYFYDKYDIPEPEEGDELVEPKSVTQQQQQSQQRFPGTIPTPTFQEQEDEQVRFIAPGQEDIDSLGDDAIEKSSINLKHLIDITNQSSSFEELQRKVRDSFGKLDLSEFERVLSQALFVANLQGRSLE